MHPSNHLTRRTFIAASAASVSALALPRPTPAQPAAGPTPAAEKRTLRKAAMLGMVGEGATLLERFQILRDCGFEGAELDSPSNLNPDEILAAQEKTGLVVHGLVDSVHWQMTLSNPDAAVRAEGLKALETALRDAKRFGSTSILLVPGIVNNDVGYDECYARSQEEIRKALPLTEECGVRIAIENVWNNFLLSPLEAARYVDDFKSPWVGFHFDIGNVINYGYPAQWVRILGQRTLKLHIKDFSRKKRNDEGLWKGFDVELGDGDADWPATMKALDDTGYSTAPAGNWATAEVRGGDRARLQQVSDQMDRLFAM